MEIEATEEAVRILTNQPLLNVVPQEGNMMFSDRAYKL